MHKTTREAIDFVKTLAPQIAGSQAKVSLAVPFTSLESLKDCGIEIGAQNIHDEEEGPYTGEISAKMVCDAGASFVLLGHSERRHLFHEGCEFVNKKVKRALMHDLRPVVCVGETLEERKGGKMESVLEEQLLGSLAGLTKEEISKIDLAYEPVWAIGTGQVASKEDARTAHRFCRQVIGAKWGQKIGEELVIQYGGSVKPENVVELLECDEIDGFLVGGASLDPHLFAKIINLCEGI